MLCNFYKIINTTNNLVYVGSTTYTIKERFNSHKLDYKRFKYKLYEAINKIGIDNFDIELLESDYYNDKNRFKREQYYIDQFDSLNNGYNQLNAFHDKKQYYEDHKSEQLCKQKEKYEENKEEILNDRKKYYNENKEKIKLNHKDHYNNNKEVICNKRKIFVEKNKEKIYEQNKLYQELNRDKINLERREIIDCECGKRLSKGGYLRHKKSQKHMDYIKNLNI